MTVAIFLFTLTNFLMGVIATLAIVVHESGIIEENSAIICVGITLVAFVTLACSGAMLSLMCDSNRKERDRLSASWLSTLEKNRELQQELEKMRNERRKQINGAIIAFDPCHTCESHDMCLMCELTLRRDGALRTDKWISVEERLPDKSGKYIVCNAKGMVYQTKFYTYPKDQGGHWGQKDKGRSITHWMPLPEAPKGGAE